MTGPEHYQFAEQLLTKRLDWLGDSNLIGTTRDMSVLAEAQVHATLALFQATAEVIAEVRDLAVARETPKAV